MKKTNSMDSCLRRNDDKAQERRVAQGRRGLGLCVLGLGLMALSGLIGHGSYCWWELPVFIAGWALVTGGLVRANQL